MPKCMFCRYIYMSIAQSASRCACSSEKEVRTLESRPVTCQCCPLPNPQLVVWPPPEPDLGGLSKERKTIRANWDSFPHTFWRSSPMSNASFYSKWPWKWKRKWEIYISANHTSHYPGSWANFYSNFQSLEKNSSSRYFGAPHQLGKLRLHLARAARFQTN